MQRPELLFCALTNKGINQILFALQKEKSRAKNNRDELKFVAQKVSSDYQIFNRSLSCKYERGFAELAAGEGAAGSLPAGTQSPL
jgi:hypothetical protein